MRMPRVYWCKPVWIWNWFNTPYGVQIDLPFVSLAFPNGVDQDAPR